MKINATGLFCETQGLFREEQFPGDPIRHSMGKNWFISIFTKEIIGIL